MLLLTALLLVACSNQLAAIAQVAPRPLTKAIQATELPEGAWGAYSRAHAGPCYLADRFPQQLYTFPIVIGQSRAETIRTLKVQPDGKKRLQASDVVLRRRSIGLAPVHADSDDLSSPATVEEGNRQSHAMEADADGYLWKHRISFSSARPAQHIFGLPDDTGVPRAAAEWGPGEATVTCFPAFVDQVADGLLIRIELSNSSSSVQTWFVDVLGGIDTMTEQFLPGDLGIETSPTFATLKHKQTNQAFCIAARGSTPVETAVVSDEYFAQSANEAPADRHGKSGPAGALVQDLPDPKSGKWALVREDGIDIAAGQHEVVWFCVGVGKDADAASASARTLLSVAEDAPADTEAAARTGAFARETAAHELSAYRSGNPVIDQLIAGSNLKVPCTVSRRPGTASISRRLGTASRVVQGESIYRPDMGGYIGLGWARYRPDWTATQLNAWFVTLSDPSAPLNTNHARRSADLFVAWQLYQETGSDIISLWRYLYPFARHQISEELVARMPAQRRIHGSLRGPKICSPMVESATGGFDPVADPECSATNSSVRIADSLGQGFRCDCSNRPGRGDPAAREEDIARNLHQKRRNSDLWQEYMPIASAWARPVSGRLSPAANVRANRSAGRPGAISWIAPAQVRCPMSGWRRCSSRSVGKDPESFWSKSWVT